ncbi:FRG domain-containing protein [Acaryochloris sp. 'Moss Beach']|uniref:FRG domain-containing protein n=1 Tax=Acaryochloris sp. 'Moss Beach' TaxID=2740837 RepID=UPI0028F3F919|nr:FRG domain-containing protein [Acaryochloris sp. 'Moss Beach']
MESITGHQFNTQKKIDLKSHLLNAKVQPDYFDFPSYEFAIYLRHHGFPSPLLDWSRSFYVAAFFAFQKPIPPEDKIAIFVYIERPEGTKFVHHLDPTIISLPPFTSAHKRHYAQQAEYTICAQWNEGNGYILRPHSDVLDLNIESQDMLTKITLYCRRLVT